MIEQRNNRDLLHTMNIDKYDTAAHTSSGGLKVYIPLTSSSKAPPNNFKIKKRNENNRTSSTAEVAPSKREGMNSHIA